MKRLIDALCLHVLIALVCIGVLILVGALPYILGLFALLFLRIIGAV
jgi:hypothetical protein